MPSHCQQRRRSIAKKASRSILKQFIVAHGGYICVIPAKKIATMNGETTTLGFKIQYMIFDNVRKYRILNPLLYITNLTTSVCYFPDSSITTFSFKS